MSQPLDQIPVVDLRDLSSSKLADQERAAAAILHGFGHYGLIYIRDHGIEQQTLDQFYTAFLQFTARPESEKRKVSSPDIWYQRGWTPPNTEQAIIAGGQPDFKECYFIAPEPVDEIARTQFPEVYADNVWPEGLENFKERYMEIGHQLHEVGLSLLRGCARALGLPPYSIEAAVYGGAHVTRALRYLPLSPEQVGTNIIWGEEHTDFNLLTLLPGGHFYDPNGERCARPDPKCGLYLRTRPTPEHPQGQMVSGTPPAGCIVAQVGQELEILTGGKLLATPHVISAPDKPGYSRTSMAHFIHLHAHQLLQPLPPFRSPDVLKAYSPPVLAGTYAHKTLIDIGLAPRETLNQLGYRHYDRLSTMRASEQ